MKLEEVCFEPYEACFCFLKIDHDGPHVCECTGSWEIYKGKRIPLVLPLGYVIPIEDVREMKEAIDYEERLSLGKGD